LANDAAGFSLVRPQEVRHSRVRFNIRFTKNIPRVYCGSTKISLILGLLSSY